MCVDITVPHRNENGESSGPEKVCWQEFGGYIGILKGVTTITGGGDSVKVISANSGCSISGDHPRCGD